MMWVSAISAPTITGPSWRQRVSTSGSSGTIFLPQACGTGTDNIESRFFHLMAIEPPSPLKRDPLHTDVVNPAAVTTVEGMMGFSLVVVMCLRAFDGYLLTDPVFFKEIKGVIDR